MADKRIVDLPAVTVMAATDLRLIEQDVGAGAFTSSKITVLNERIAIFGGFTAIGQLPFPATQIPSADANTLDDYEEGTWTPVLRFGGLSVGITYGTQSAVYTVIGNKCFFNCTIILTNKGSSTGAANVAGLPFTNTGSYCGIVAYCDLMTSITGGYLGYLNPSSATLVLAQAGTGSSTALADTNFGNGSQLFLTGHINR